MDDPRVPRRDELDDLADLIGRCFGGAVHREARARGGRQTLDRAGGRGRRRVPRESWIIAEDGKPVSHIRVAYNALSLYGCRVKIASIGGVCTDPDYRGRGIASTLLRFCAEEARRAGAVLLLISGARGLYLRAGAAKVGPTLSAEVTADAARGLKGSVGVRPANPDDWTACASLYGAEPVRFVRSAEFFAEAFGGRSGRRRAWVVESAGKPAAYVTLSRIWGLPAEEPVRAAAEYAGSRVALAGGLHDLLEAAELREIELSAAAHDRELVGLLASGGIELKRGTLREHTVLLLDLPRLMGRLRGYVRARLERGDARQLSFEQGEGSCAMCSGEERLDCTVAEAARLVFGGRGAPRVSGELGRAASALFPVPLPMPGMNYV